MELHNLSESEPKPLRKPWHTPMCTKKHWQTPQLVPISFDQTRSGGSPGPESSTANPPS
jgi:hypothetical protein